MAPARLPSGTRPPTSPNSPLHFKLIPDSPYSSQRPFIVIFNLFTETLDMYVYSSGVTDIFITPDMIQELLPCKYLIGGGGEEI